MNVNDLFNAVDEMVVMPNSPLGTTVESELCKRPMPHLNLRPYH